MKKYAISALTLVLSLQAGAASVTAKLKSDATESQAQQVKEAAEKSTGKAAEVVRDESGKVVSVNITLQENESKGIAQATEVLIANKGVATVQVSTVTTEEFMAACAKMTELTGMGLDWNALNMVSTGFSKVLELDPALAQKILNVLNTSNAIGSYTGWFQTLEVFYFGEAVANGQDLSAPLQQLINATQSNSLELGL